MYYPLIIFTITFSLLSNRHLDRKAKKCRYTFFFFFFFSLVIIYQATREKEKKDENNWTLLSCYHPPTLSFSLSLSLSLFLMVLRTERKSERTISNYISTWQCQIKTTNNNHNNKLAVHMVASTMPPSIWYVREQMQINLKSKRKRCRLQQRSDRRVRTFFSPSLRFPSVYLLPSNGRGSDGNCGHLIVLPLSVFFFQIYHELMNEEIVENNQNGYVRWDVYE
jgi:hypothetical protein